MNIKFSYSDHNSQNISINLSLDLKCLVREVRIRLSQILEMQISSFHLVASIFGQKVLLTDTWPLSFFMLEKPEIKIRFLESNNLRKSDSKSLNTYCLSNTSFQQSIGVKMEIAKSLCKNNEFQAFIKLIETDDISDQSLLDYTGENKWTLLHHVCLIGNSRFIRYLISKSVNTNKVTIDEWTALQIACFFKYSECVEALLSSKLIQINKKTKFRGTALHLACQNGDVAIVKMLIGSNPVINIEDHTGKTALEYVKNCEILEMLAVYSGQFALKFVNLEKGGLPFCGEVVLVNSYGLSDRTVFLYLDPPKGVILKYDKKSDYLDKLRPLSQIILSDIQSTSIECNKREMYFFIVETQKTTYRFFTKFELLTKEWAGRIMKAVRFVYENPQIDKSIFESFGSENDEISEDVSVRISTILGEAIDISSFSILNDIGKGSFGTVHRVVKINSGEIFALKTIRKSTVTLDKLKYAISEYKILKDLNHPFILPLHYAFQTADFIYLVLEFCPHGDLEKRISKIGKLQEKVAKFYLAEAVLAIEYLHNAGIIYRDLKPANILISHDYHIRLADFGLAKEGVNKCNPALSLAGTPAYLAPEVIKKKGATQASDIYGFGPLLFELLTGEPPYYTEDLSTLLKNIKKCKLKLPYWFSDHTKDFITQVMHKCPLKRPSISQVKRHQFFRKVDWNGLLMKKGKSPDSVLINLVE